ncbi:MAG: hypothetical protein CSA81_12660 [Acidobacteria bacterium]|nr:MAG: hypothetical protein CSA81_12660 [Acidobacteriota bacterium]PIE90264.1 MAG: hypothetical protein CR997_06655 [Acidobacteriota bacterium]
MLAVLYDIVTSINLSGPLQWVALLVVICLLSSPGAMFTMVGLGAKVGFARHLMDKAKHPQGEATN